MVDSGSSKHFLDPFLIPGLQNRMMDYKALDEPRKIFTAGDHVLERIGTGTVHGTVKDGHGRKTAINFSAFVVPGLGRNLFSVHTSVTKGVVAVFDSVNPRFEIGNTVIPLKPPSPPNNLYSFSMDFNSTVDAAGVALRTESAALWHRRVGHINTRSMDILRKEKRNGVEYTGDLPTYDVCALGKSAQQAHPKRASYDVSRPFQLVTTDLMGPLSPPALGGLRYTSKFLDQLTKWNEVFLLKEKNSAVDTVQLYNQAVVIPSGLRLERLRVDKGGENTGAAFRKCCFFFFFFLFLFHLTYSRWTSSLPSCLWSQRIFPSLPGSRLTTFVSRCKFSTLTTRQPMVEFYLLTFPRFPLRKKEHKSYFGKNRTHDFRTSRCAAYLLDHSSDEQTYT